MADNNAERRVARNQLIRVEGRREWERENNGTSNKWIYKH